jgi:CDP-diacylglycerol--serine O-phosphatidyltransferase
VESKHFIGLPIPAAACTVASCVLLFYYLGGAGTIRMVSVVVLIYALAFLMVSNITFYSFKDPALFRRRPFWNLVLAVFIVLIIVARPEVMIFIMCLIYTLFTPVIAGMAQLRKYRRGKAEV